MPMPMHTLTPQRDAEAAMSGCILALACVVVFACVIWGGCYAAYTSRAAQARLQALIENQTPKGNNPK